MTGEAWVPHGRGPRSGGWTRVAPRGVGVGAAHPRTAAEAGAPGRRAVGGLAIPGIGFRVPRLHRLPGHRGASRHAKLGRTTKPFKTARKGCAKKYCTLSH